MADREESLRMSKTELARAYIGTLYALWQVVTEVDGYDHDLARNIHNIITYRDRKRIPGRARHVQDRFAKACQDLWVWNAEDREKLKCMIFSDWLDWRSFGPPEGPKIEALPEVL